MIMSLIFLFISFILLHGYLLGDPFESYLSILVTLYLLACAWAFPYILKEMNHIIESVIKSPISFILAKGMYVIFYFLAPIVFIKLKFFDNK